MGKVCATCENHSPQSGWCKRHGYEVDSQFMTCIMHTAKNDTMEQRYEQLAQVAWEMLQDFQDAQQCVFDGHTDTAIDRVRAACGLYPKKLKALGVDE